MNLPTEKGDYLASPVKWTVGETKEKKLPQFVCQWSISQQWDGSGYVDVSGDQFEISSYMVLFNTDGQANKINIDTLKEVFGWDGRTIAALNEGDWSGVQARLYVEPDTYNGKTSMKVKYINPADSTPGGGGIEKADPQTIQSLDAKYGAMLRAMNPASPGKQANGKPAPAGAQGAEVGKREAWTLFLSKWSDHVKQHPEDAEHKNDRWKETVSQLIPDVSKATFADWKKVINWLNAVSLSPQIPEESIPF